MKPPVFDYVAPQTLEHALDLLADTEREVKVLGGGQSLMPVLNMRMAHPELLVDVRRISGLDRLDVDESGSLVIGARVTQARVQTDAVVQLGWPLLVEGIGHIGHPQIRNRGTVCGSLVHHDPSAELPALAVALDATIRVASAAGIREVTAEKFFIATFMTDVEPNELVTEVIFPAQQAGTGWAFGEFARRRGDFATVGVAVLLRGDGDTITDARVVFCGAGSTPVRASRVEAALKGARASDPDLLDAACREIAHDLQPPEDIHASAQFRLEIAGTLLTDAVRTAWERCS